jgi:hypothetical protein
MSDEVVESLSIFISEILCHLTPSQSTSASSWMAIAGGLKNAFYLLHWDMLRVQSVSGRLWNHVSVVTLRTSVCSLSVPKIGGVRLKKSQF